MGAVDSLNPSPKMVAPVAEYVAQKRALTVRIVIMQTAIEASPFKHIQVNSIRGPVFLPLTKGKLAEIDPEDLFTIGMFKWCFFNGYAVRFPHQNGKEITIRMHRVVNQTPDHLFTDHINGDKLDNRRSNLRIATRSQNSWNSKKLRKHNTSGFKGVSWHKRNQMFHAEIRAFGKHYHLGNFKTAEEASSAYKDASIRLHGEFARK